MLEITFSSVKDYVFEADLQRLGPKLHWKCLIWVVAQIIKERWIDRRRFFSDQPRERRALGAVALSRCTEAAEQVYFERRRFCEFVRRQLCTTLVEVVGNPHRA